ncbi:MAG: hypothetical protein O7D29_13035 [Gemmatimonadetes bacterium]|nr:hypothetical protein [Gemmatimonadota bacterium]
MRTAALLLVLTMIAAPAIAQDDPDQAVAGASVAEGWSIRTDRGRGEENVSLQVDDGVFNLTLGPRVIFYRETDQGSGEYTVSATFTQLAANRHNEAFGLFIGGDDLQGSGQRYSYFLLRGDGKFLVKNRTGNETSNVSSGWTRHEAINADNSDGQSSDELTVQVSGGRVSFLVNGTEVYSGSSGLYTEGVYGMRANHNLHLRIEGFEATPR